MARNNPVVDRAELESYLRDGLSLEDIGRLVHKDASTVGYWVRKHGLTANGRAKHGSKGGLDRDRLTRLIDTGMTQSELAHELGCSPSTIRYWLRKHDSAPPEPDSRSPSRSLGSLKGSARRTASLPSFWRGGATTAVRHAARSASRSGEGTPSAGW